MQVTGLFTGFSHPDKLAQASLLVFLSATTHRSILSSQLSRLVEFSPVFPPPFRTFKACSCLALYAATLTPAASAAQLKQMRPGENKAGGPRGGVNNTHLEVCHAVARWDTLKARPASWLSTLFDLQTQVRCEAESV